MNLMLWSNLTYCYTSIVRFLYCNFQICSRVHICKRNINITYIISIKVFTTDTHYNDVTMSAMASEITSVLIVYSTVCSGEDQRKHQSSASLASVWGIHWSPVNSPHKKASNAEIFPFADVIMAWTRHQCQNL